MSFLTSVPGNQNSPVLHGKYGILNFVAAYKMWTKLAQKRSVRRYAYGVKRAAFSAAGRSPGPCPEFDNIR